MKDGTNSFLRPIESTQENFWTCLESYEKHFSMKTTTKKPRRPRNYFKKAMANSQRLTDSFLIDAVAVIRSHIKATETGDAVVPGNILVEGSEAYRSFWGSITRKRLVEVAAHIEAEILLRRLLRENSEVKCCLVCGNSMPPQD